MTISIPLVMLAAAAGLDRLATPRQGVGVRAPLAAWGLGGTVVLWLWLLWLGLSARPLFAAVAALVTLGVFVTISRVKYAYLREPLVFSDLGFLMTLIRHPDLFYVDRRSAAGIGLAALMLIGVIAGWTWFEPRQFGALAQMGVLALALLVAAVLLAAAGSLAPMLARLAPSLLETPPEQFVARLGLSASLVAGFALWRRDGRVERGDLPVAPIAVNGRYRAVVMLQMESFADLRRYGVPLSLPNLERLRPRALAQGRLDVSCYGAYTHRSEVEMLTGVPFARQRMDRFDPYLRPERLASASLAGLLATAGWRTTFIHPHDARFFRRDRAIPRLGFARFIGEDAFQPADRYGPYVGDRALGRHIAREISAAAEAGEPLFLMSISMEAHDPYGPGRLPAIDEPVAQYAHHLANADAMLGLVTAALDTLTDRALLVFYGDHAPLLPGHAALAEDRATDYLVLECGWAAAKPKEGRAPSRRSPAEINALVRSALVAGRQDGAGSGAGAGAATASMRRSTIEK
ncbi:phosphoglycerol transferase MdoB-like AlkP superfamily enzyme [Angulomicrobium tetraedrale]|uniref:Phosphoglycerol transferase MdoB-like AlkP superfamily enzyme n=1 Tax=Ancylobacter tetraedralis TaxID=217068 RepID=A0A839ZG94_9HYPH|nr:phosphoglycerol transferase MdoB-like AlkP superfamily enzyme [Ancylobacter tetraedralis]